MSILKELIALSESEAELKAPSYAEMQKAIYKTVTAKFLAIQDKRHIGDLTIGTLRYEAENDRFWVAAFDEAHRALERFCDGSKDMDYVIDDLGNAMDEVAEKIYDYYTNKMNFAPGTRLPTLKRPEETDADEISQLIFDLVPGAKELDDASRERQGAVNMMHKDFSKIAMQQRMGKEGKAAVAPFEEAIAKVCAQLRKDKAFIVSIGVGTDDIEFICRLDTPRGEIIQGAKFISKDEINLPPVFKSVSYESNRGRRETEEYRAYVFSFKDEVGLPVRKLIQNVANHYIDKAPYK